MTPATSIEPRGLSVSTRHHCSPRRYQTRAEADESVEPIRCFTRPSRCGHRRNDHGRVVGKRGSGASAGLGLRQRYRRCRLRGRDVCAKAPAIQSAPGEETHWCAGADVFGGVVGVGWGAGWGVVCGSDDVAIHGDIGGFVRSLPSGGGCCAGGAGGESGGAGRAFLGGGSVAGAASGDPARLCDHGEAGVSGDGWDRGPAGVRADDGAGADVDRRSGELCGGLGGWGDVGSILGGEHRLSVGADRAHL